MSNASAYFRDFMCTGAKDEYFRFLEEDANDGDSFNVNVDGSTFAVHLFDGMKHELKILMIFLKKLQKIKYYMQSDILIKQ